MNNKVLNVILIGGGVRGMNYISFAKENPDMFKVVAVAEPNDDRRNFIKEEHNIPEEMCFKDWKEVLSRPKFADVVFITTMDRMHYEPAMAAIDLKYDILLEKPIAPTLRECVDIEQNAIKNNVKVVVCHVLRYTDFYKALKNFIDDGKLGRIITINYTEGAGNIHFSHSYVRGQWRNTKETAPFILAKSCHDTDILRWLTGKKCKKIQSFGELTYFTHKNKPEGSPERCIEGCPYADTCYYDTKKLYEETDYYLMKCVATGLTHPTDEDVRYALKNGLFGRCVYSCDNDAVDHQTVNMEFEDGITAVFTVAAYNQGGRRIRIMGTKGDVDADFEHGRMTFYNFETSQNEELKISEIANSKEFAGGGGHGGGDTGIMIDLYNYICGNETSKSVSSIDVSVDSHVMAFAAEESRRNGGKTIDLENRN